MEIILTATGGGRRGRERSALFCVRWLGRECRGCERGVSHQNKNNMLIVDQGYFFFARG